MLYIHERKDWPAFTWETERLVDLLATISHLQGRLIGRMEAMGFTLRDEASLLNMTNEILKSNEIEGEILDYEQVRSSIARRLGIETAGMVNTDRFVEGVVEVLMDATQHFEQVLTEDRLFGWHAALFPTGRSGMQKITAGQWRTNTPDDPMQVVSGAMGKEKVHFKAPESALVPDEMSAFLEWFNAEAGLHPLLKAAVAHLWFLTIHPFDDGNGRLARTIADMLLTRADQTRHRFYSMSAQIRLERNAYYNILEQTQKGSMDITAWMEWFLGCLGRALSAADQTSAGIIYKARFWDFLAKKQLNNRQMTMVNLLLDQKFFGKLNTSKWAKMMNTSPDTALRDIQSLVEQGVLMNDGAGGRSTTYSLKPLQG